MRRRVLLTDISPIAVANSDQLAISNRRTFDVSIPSSLILSQHARAWTRADTYTSDPYQSVYEEREKKVP